MSQAVCATISFPLLMWAEKPRRGKSSVVFSLSFHWQDVLITSKPVASLGTWSGRHLAEGIRDLWLFLLQHYTKKTKATGCQHLGHTGTHLGEFKKLLRPGHTPEVWICQCRGTVWMWRIWNLRTFQHRKESKTHSLSWDLHDLLQKLRDLGRAMPERDVGIWAATLS